MKCAGAELLIIDLLKDGRIINPSEELSVHLNSCDSCKAFFLKFSSDVSVVAEGRRVKPDPALYSRIVMNIESNTNHPVHVFKPAGRYLRMTPAIATAAAAVIAGIWLGGWLMDVSLSNDQRSEVTTLSVRTGLLEAYAEDIHLYDASEIMLENYLAENENETEIRP